jgi:hypothetical protein
MLTHMMLKGQAKQSKVTQRRPDRPLIAARECLTEIRNPSVFSGIWTCPLTLGNADPRISQSGPKLGILEVNLTLGDWEVVVPKSDNF